MEPWIHIPYANLLLSVLTVHLEKLQGSHFLHYLARNYQELQTFKNSNILFHTIDFNFFSSWDSTTFQKKHSVLNIKKNAMP